METDRKIRVLIVDDHEMVRYGLKVLIETVDDLKIVDETGDARMVLTLCETYKPDVVLMDLAMPYLDGVAATRLIRSQYPDTQVVYILKPLGHRHWSETAALNDADEIAASILMQPSEATA